MTDIINRLIKRRYITADEAALAIAGIDPAWVNDSVQSAIDGNYIGWEMARDVKKSIVEAVCDGDISANRIFNKTTKDGRFSHQLKRSLSGRILNPEHINSIELKAIELWPWLHRIGWLNEPIESPYSTGNGSIDPKSAELPRTPGIERIIRAMDADKEYGAQIVELKRQLASTQDELAKLRIDGEQSADPRQKHIQVIKSLLSLIPEIEDNSPTRAHEIINTLLRGRGLPELEVTDRTFRNWLNQG